MPSPRDPDFPAPTEITFTAYDPADERRRESLFGLGNGVLFVRAAPAEAEPGDPRYYQGSYRAGCYSRRVLQPQAQEFGHDTLVNLPNWLPLTFRIVGEEAWFSLCRGELLSYRHVLDMANGVAERLVLFRDARGRRTRIREQRLVSMVRPMLAALRLELTADDWSGRIEFRSALDGNVVNHNTDRDALPGIRYLEVSSLDFPTAETLSLAACTRQSRIALAVVARTRVNVRARRSRERSSATLAQQLSCNLAAGRTLTVEKVAAIATARDPAAGEPSEAARAAVADAADFASLQQEHAAAWHRLWKRVGIEAEHSDVQQGVAFHAFHLLQTVSPHTVHADAGLPARGWQEAYHGQIFWDEIFAFPFLNHRFPEIARALLLYRYRRLPAARRAAREAGYAGAMFPWRSGTTGAEETPRYQHNPLTGRWIPDDTRLQRHIGSAIAHNVWSYYLATGDESFLIEYGAEMVVEIARFWASIARHDPGDDRYDICGVIGPDEYHNAYPGAAAPRLDNNAYTNVLAVRTLCRAANILDRLPPGRRDELAVRLRLSDDEPRTWRRVASRMRLCFLDDGIICQFAGFDRLKPFDGRGFAERHPDGRVDWMLQAAGDTVDAYQVTKQADVLMLPYLLPPDDLIALVRSMGYSMDRDRLSRTVRYYLDRITHESSLSRIVCAGALAQLDPHASWTFFARSLCIDFDPSNSTSAEEGLHLGAMAGTLDVLQRHYLGLDLRDDGVVITPAPPPELGPVCMRLQYHGASLALRWDGARLRLCAAPSNRAAVPVWYADRADRLAAGNELSFVPGM